MKNRIPIVAAVSISALFLSLPGIKAQTAGTSVPSLPVPATGPDFKGMEGIATGTAAAAAELQKAIVDIKVLDRLHSWARKLLEQKDPKQVHLFHAYLFGNDNNYRELRSVEYVGGGKSAQDALMQRFATQTRTAIVILPDGRVKTQTVIEDQLREGPPSGNYLIHYNLVAIPMEDGWDFRPAAFTQKDIEDARTRGLAWNRQQSQIMLEKERAVLQKLQQGARANAPRPHYVGPGQPSVPFIMGKPRISIIPRFGPGNW